MGRRVVLHIGTMKSGTSFLQSVLATNHEHLRTHGVDVVGAAGSLPEDRADGDDGDGGGSQRAHPHRAAEEVLHGNRGYERWHEVLDQVGSSSEGTAVISSEFFSFLDTSGVRTVVDAFAEVDLTVVVTVRDQLTAIPAQWQTFTRNFGAASFADYLTAITSGPGRGRRTRAYRTFHRAQDVPEILARWRVPGVDRLRLVTVPPSGAEPLELWDRFCAAGGFDGSGVSLEEVSGNESLGYASCEYLRLANAHLGDLPGRRYRRLMRPMANQALTPLRREQGKPILDRATARWGLARNEEVRAELRAAGGDLFGAVDDVAAAVDLSALPDHVVAPDPAQVRASALAAFDYAARRAGSEAAPPEDLETLVKAGVDLLLAGRKRSGKRKGKGRKVRP